MPRRFSVRALACAVLLGPLPLMQPAPAAAAGFTTSDGVRLAYTEAGSGDPTLIFVPGWTMPGSIWRPQLEHFARRFRVIAFDPRGQGDSEVPQGGYTPERRARDLAELIDAVRAQRPVIIGWSLAVLEALAYVKLHGDGRHAGLVLVDNSVGEEPPPSSKYDIVAALRRDREATVRGFVRSMFRTPQSDAYLEDLTRQALRTPLDQSIALLSWPWPRGEWRAALYATSRPVLYVVTPQFAAQAANVHRHRPDIAVEVFKDAGHALFVDRAERFNAVLERFLGRLAAAR